MIKQIIRISAVAVSVCTICVVSYLYAENLVSYEAESKTPVATATAENSFSGINSIPESIPYSSYYDMYLKDGYIFVFNCESLPVYKNKTDRLNGLTPNDIKQLEQNGIHYTVRSELVEILNYIGS